MGRNKSALNPIAYTGVNAQHPPDFTIMDRAPTSDDYKEFNVGHIVLDNSSLSEVPPRAPTAENLWMLVSKDQRIAKATWINMASTSQRSAFTAYLSANQDNVTGAGTKYQIPFDSTYSDTGNDFDTATGRYVAPADGVYNFTTGITADNITAAMTTGFAQFFIQGTGPVAGLEWAFVRENPANARDTSAQSRWRINGSATIPLNAGDTVEVTIEVNQGAGNTVRIFTRGGTIRSRTWFAGCRVF